MDLTLDKRRRVAADGRFLCVFKERGKQNTHTNIIPKDEQYNLDYPNFDQPNTLIIQPLNYLNALII